MNVLVASKDAIVRALGACCTKSTSLGKQLVPVAQRVVKTSVRVAWWAIRFFALVGLFYNLTTPFITGAGLAALFPEHTKRAFHRMSVVFDHLSVWMRVGVFLPALLAGTSYCIIAAPLAGAWSFLALQEYLEAPNNPA